jgi:hypothetical protein
MNQTMLALLVGLVAGAGGAFTFHLIQGAGTSGDSGLVAAADGSTSSVQQELMAIREELAALRAPTGGLKGRAPRPMTAEGPGSPLAADPEAVEALLARIDERVGKAVEKKMAEAAEEKPEGSSGRRGGRRGRKRTSLADAARELELSAAQEDELRRIYEDSQNRFFKLMAEPDGDPEDVKREVMEASKTPGGGMKLVGKYMPKMLSKMGDVMAIEADRQAAITKTVGPEKARKLERDYSIEEDDILGMRGGGGMSFGVEVDGK